MGIEEGKVSLVWSYIVDKGLDPNKAYTVTEKVFNNRTGNFQTVTKFSSMTPLFWAALNGKADVAKCLIQKGADVDKKEVEGMRPIHTAAKRGYLDVVKILVYNDCELNVKDPTDNNKTPLQYAEEQEHFKIVKFLKEQANKSSSSSSSTAKADVNAFVTAADKGNLDAVKKQISLGVDINVLDNKTGWTALTVAAYQGRTDVVKYLISKGANLEKRYKNTKTGEIMGTALWVAARNGHLDCVKALAEAKADINAKYGNGGSTPLGIATNQGKTEVVNYLKSKGAK